MSVDDWVEAPRQHPHDHHRANDGGDHERFANHIHHGTRAYPRRDVRRATKPADPEPQGNPSIDQPLDSPGHHTGLFEIGCVDEESWAIDGLSDPVGEVGDDVESVCGSTQHH